MKDTKYQDHLAQAWKTTSIKQKNLFSVKTHPDLPSTPKLRVTPRRPLTFRFSMEQKQMPMERAHNLILKSMHYMPKDIINSINLQHFQNEFKIHNSISVQELEYELLDCLEKMASQIIDPLFKEDATLDKIGIKVDSNPYKKFNISILPKMAEIINSAISASLKYLIPLNEKIPMCIQHAWKYVVYILDLCMQWSTDRNNMYIVDQVTKLQRKIDNCKGEIKQLEQRLVKTVQEHEQEMQQEKMRYYELSSNYERLQSKAIELEKTITEDIRTVADGGTFQLKKNIKEMEQTLKYLDSQFYQQEEEFVIGLTKVAVVANKNKESITNKFRHYLGININAQMPGDQVLSTLFTEHPFYNYLQIRNLYSYYEETPYNFEQESKLELLHRTLLLEQCQQNLCFQFAQQFNCFSDLYKSLQTLLFPYEEASIVGVQLQQLIGALFNLQGYETIEQKYINQIKQFYQEINYSLISIQQKALNPDQNKDLDIDDEYLLKRILKLNLNQPRAILSFGINKIFATQFLTQLPVQEQILQILETKRDISVLFVTHFFLQELIKQSKQQLQQKIDLFEIPSDITQYGKQVCQTFFPDLNLDAIQIQTYIIARICYLKEQDIKLNQECFQRTEQSSFRSIQIPKDLFQDIILQIRNILLFNPQIFSTIDKPKIKKQCTIK